MASSLNIIANHRIQFTTPEHVIEQFEKSLNVQVLNRNGKDLHSILKTENFNESKFYVNKESLKNNFEKWNYVEIMSNYKPLYNFKILKKTILIFTNLLIKYWRPLLEDESFDESLKSQFQYTSHNWSLIKEEANIITEKLNGSQILYLSDDYENISDLCYEGELNIQGLIKKITENYNATQLNWIKENGMKKRLRHNWLNLKIDENNNWDLDPNEI